MFGKKERPHLISLDAETEEFWKDAYLASVNTGSDYKRSHEEAVHCADRAVIDLRRRQKCESAKLY